MHSEPLPFSLEPLAFPFPALSLAFVALLAARRAAEAPGTRACIAAGAVAGVAAWFRQDVGLVAAVAVGAAIWTGTVGAVRVRAGRAAVAGLAAAAVLALLLVPAILRAPAQLYKGLVTNPAATVPFRM